jgi:hypothetical protein
MSHLLKSARKLISWSTVKENGTINLTAVWYISVETVWGQVPLLSVVYCCTAAGTTVRCHGFTECIWWPGESSCIQMWSSRGSICLWRTNEKDDCSSVTSQGHPCQGQRRCHKHTGMCIIIHKQVNYISTVEWAENGHDIKQNEWLHSGLIIRGNFFVFSTFYLSPLLPLHFHSSLLLNMWKILFISTCNEICKSYKVM